MFCFFLSVLGMQKCESQLLILQDVKNVEWEINSRLYLIHETVAKLIRAHIFMLSQAELIKARRGSLYSQKELNPSANRREQQPPLVSVYFTFMLLV